MTTALLIIHGLVAVALLGAITHQTLATWAPAHTRPGSFFGRFRAVSSASFANAVVVLYRGLRAAGRDSVPLLPRRHQARVGARRPLVGARLLRPQGAFHRYRVGTPAGLLGLLEAAACRRTRSNANRRDRGTCLHRLVELSNRSRHEQHQGLRVMMSAHAFRSFAFAFATRSRSFTWSRSRRISRCSPFFRRLASSFPARSIREMSPTRRWGSLPPRCTGTAGPLRPRSERSRSALSPRVPRTMDPTDLARMVVDDSRVCDDRVRLSHPALVSTLVRTGVIRQVTSDEG